MAESKVPSGGPQEARSYVAGAAIAASHANPLAVKLSADNTVITCTTDSTETVAGVVYDNVASGDDVAVWNGHVICIAGEPIARDEWVCPSAVTAGRVDDADTSTDRAFGKALSAAAAAGDRLVVDTNAGDYIVP